MTRRERIDAMPKSRALAWLALACALLAVPAVRSATVPTGFQEYHVVGHEQHMWDLFNRPVAEQAPIAYALSNAMLSVVAATVSSANQVIYYDHWEDNVDSNADGVPDFEADIVNAQSQPETLVLGDGNPANGDACTFIVGPCINDTIALGDTLTLNSDGNTGTGAAPACGGPLNYQGCVVVNPRNPADIRFDGGDRLVASGGPVSLVHVQEPTANLSGILGGAVEIISRQAVGPATSYSVPIGQDSPANLGAPGNAFVRVDLDLVAYDDNTAVTVTSPGAGSVSFTLQAGQHWTSQGQIDSAAIDPTIALVINEGTKVSTNKPLAGLIFGSPNGFYATRVFALLPDLLHSTDYITTAPGDDPAVQGSEPKDLFVYNPDSVNAMTVTFTDAVGTGTFAVGPNATVAYSSAAGAGRNPPVGSTVRLSSDRNFWGVSAYDSQGVTHDWGHSWLAVPFLTDTYTAPYSPDNPGAPPGASPIFVSATTANTCVQVDFDNDLVPDQIGDGNGALLPFDCAPGGYLVNAPGSAGLNALRVYDDNAADGTPNNDVTGARISANKPIALAYGLDTDLAPGSGTGILDLGFWVYPVNQAFLDPVLTIDKSTDVGSVSIAGGPVVYTLLIRAYDFGPLTGLTVTDLLPAGVPATSYVPGSTTITNPDLSTVTGASADPMSTPGARDVLDWSAALAANVDTLQANQTLTIEYTIDIPAGAAGIYTNDATATAALGASVFAPTDTADVVQTDVTLTKSVTDDGSPEVGETLTYALTVQNNGVVDESVITLSDSIPADTTFVAGSIVDAGPFTGVYDPGQNAVVWTASPLAVADGPVTLSFDVRINPNAPAGTAISNAARYESAETPSFVSNTTVTTVLGPSLLVAKSASGNPNPVHPGDVVTFEITVENTGGGAARNLVIEDLLPANATFLAGSMAVQRNAGAFTSLTDAFGDDEGEALLDRLRLALGAVFEDGFEALAYDNQDGSSAWATDWIELGDDGDPAAGNIQIVAGELTLDDNPDSGGQPSVEREIDLGGFARAQLSFRFRTGSGVDASDSVMLEVSGNGGVSYTALEDFTDITGITSGTRTFDISSAIATDTRVRFRVNNLYGGASEVFSVDDVKVTASNTASALGPGEDLTFRLQVTVDAGTDGLALSNQATVSSGEVSPTDTNLVLIPIVGDATVTGHLFIDLNDDGIQQAGEPDLTNVEVVVTDEDGVVRTLTTDLNGDYSVVVPADNLVNPGQTTLDVDETDPDFPAGATLCAVCTDPQTVAAVSGGSVATSDVGYVPQPIAITKTSDGGAGVAPGEEISYTITVENVSGVNQTGVTVTDPVPANTTYVTSSTQVTAPAIRATEYYVGAGAFPPDPTPDGTPDTFTLTLGQDLEADYFVIVQGSDGNGSANRSPEDSYISLTGDPAATGALAASGAANQLQFTRGGDGVDGWVGVITVVESLPNAGSDGFSLLDVRRVGHAAGVSGGSAASGTPWADINQVMLMGGFNGAGCDTAETSTGNHPVCWTRLFPSAANTVNWARNAATSLNASASTVMVIEWGADWTVQGVNVAGSNGGGGANATGEYNTTAIAPVARANTWVWGTGHTANNGIGNGAEGVLITLGDGVATNATESLVAVGKEYAGAMDFQVWALTHPGLAADQRFLVDGNAGSATVDVTVNAASANRMALSYNGQNGTGTAFPRPVFSARYLDDTTVRLERRRTGQNFPAWIQGVDFAGVLGVAAGGAAPALVPAGAGYDLPPGATMTVTFRAAVDQPLAGGVTAIGNTATVATNESAAVSDAVVDPVVRPGVSVEPNAAGVVFQDANPQSVTFDHAVTNTGDITDSYALAVVSARGFAITLIDPATGGIVAVDSDGDGNWDGGALPNTGSLAAGASASYRVRVTVPGGAPAGTVDSVELSATSDLRATLTASAFDTVTVVEGAVTVPGAADLLVSPDNASFASAGDTVAYTHTVTNDTGATRVFVLQAVSDQGYATTVYQDSNGDGVYTPGIDSAITNTTALANGASQKIFVVVDVPAGAGAGDVDTTNITASFFDDNGTPADPLDDITFGGVASDTTTVGGSNNTIGFDLSGGGSHVVNAGDTDLFPGGLANVGNAADRYAFAIGPSVYGPGGVSADGLDHTTRLRIDSNGDGTPDLVIAEDTDGDGTWDLTDADGDGTLEVAGSLGVGQPYDLDGDGVPDVPVAAGAALVYDLQRPVALAQSPYRDPVTLTATSFAGAGSDSVSATTAILLATRAVIDGVVAYGTEHGVVVQWRTLSEHGTVGFHLERQRREAERYRRINDQLLPGLLHARNGGLYRFIDAGVNVGETHRYLIVEQEATGRLLTYGPYEVLVHRDAAAAGLTAADLDATPVTGFERVARAMEQLQLDRRAAKRAARAAALEERGARTGGRAKIYTVATGLHFVDTDSIARVLGKRAGQIRDRIMRRGLAVTHRGLPVAVLPAPGGAGLYFHAEAVGGGDAGATAQARRDDLYTDENVYWIGEGTMTVMETADAGLPSPLAGHTFHETSRAEGNRYTLTHLFDDPDGDYWMWDFRFGGLDFPDCSSVSPPAPCYETRYAVPSPGRAANPGARASLAVHLHGGSEVTGSADHAVTVRLNGTLLGTSVFDGPVPHTIVHEVDAALLVDGDNVVEIELAASPDPAQPSIVYIDEFTLEYPRRYRSVGGALEASGTGGAMSIDGFAEAQIWAFDLGEPRRPRQFVNATIDGSVGDHRITIPGAARVLAVVPGAAHRPVRIVADRASTLLDRANQVDHLVITASDLVEYAGALARYRKGQGLAAMVVDIEDIYDEFNHGIENADAIWAFLRHAHLHWQRGPRYVVLAGEGSHDYLDHLGNGDSIIPTLLTPTPDGLFPSDNLYADVVGNDFVPEMAIGRLPVIDGPELEALIEKLIAYESSGGPWTEEAVFAADAPDAGGEFVADSEAIAGSLPGHLAVERIYLDTLDAEVARERMFDALASGRAFVNFMGHGGFMGMGNASLLTAPDVARLTNEGRLPIVTAFTCLVGQFGFPGQESLGERLLVDPQVGAAAVWAPSGLSRSHRARILAEGFYRSTFEGPGELVIGETILRTQQRYAADGVDHYLLDIYNLIGDPATVMK